MKIGEGEEITPSEQKNILKPKILEMKIIVDEDYYLIDHIWFKKWKDYVGFSYMLSNSGTNSPGIIDNSPLLTNSNSSDEEMELRQNLMENFEYDIISQEIWNHLVKWFAFFDLLNF